MDVDRLVAEYMAEVGGLALMQQGGRISTYP